MKRKAPCFLVLESYWSEDLTQHESVQPFIKGLCDLNQWEFHYRTFDSANDLRLWIRNFDRIRRSREEPARRGICHAGSSRWPPGRKSRGWLRSRYASNTG